MSTNETEPGATAGGYRPLPRPPAPLRPSPLRPSPPPERVARPTPPLGSIEPVEPVGADPEQPSVATEPVPAPSAVGAAGRRGPGRRRWLPMALLATLVGTMIVAAGVTIGLLAADLGAERDRSGELGDRVADLEARLATAGARSADLDRRATGLDRQLTAVSADRDRARLAAQAAQVRDAERIEDCRTALNGLNDSWAAFTRQAIANLSLSFLGADPGEPSSVASPDVQAEIQACLGTPATGTA